MRFSWFVSPGLAVGVLLLCVRTMWLSGYPMQVDAVFGPRWSSVSPGFFAPVVAALAGITRVFGGDVAGRVYAIFALALCVVGPMAVFRRRPWFVRVAAGLLGVLNPWVYDRMADGQWAAVSAAGALFLWIAAWDRLTSRPGPRSAIAVALAGMFVATLDQHFLGPLAALVLLAVLWQRPWRDRARWRWTVAALAGLALLLLYGVIPFIIGRGGGTYAGILSFTSVDFQAFHASASPQYGLWPNLLGFYGYWAERLGRSTVFSTSPSWWPLTTAILVGLAIAGAWLRRDRAWLFPAGLVGVLIAGSTATGPGLAAFTWLDARVPLVGAYRDPTKWSALWLLAVVILAAEAVALLDERLRGRHPGADLAGPLATVLMIAATLAPAGFIQLRDLPTQLTPVRYPADWYAAATYLGSHVPESAPVVVLPWHLYVNLPFTERLTANPARVFFPGNLLTSNDPELIGEGTPPPSPGDIGNAARNPTAGCRLAGAVRSAGARWVLLEAGPDAGTDLPPLLACGFRIVEGDGTATSVLERAAT